MPINQCGLQAAESNRAVIRYIAEATDCWGVTPASGKTRELRITSSSLAASKETVVSEEIRADRMISDVIEIAASSGGDIEGEFSAGTFDDFWQAFLLGMWTRPMTFDKFEGANVSIADNAGTSEIYIAGADYTNYFVVGRRIKTEGFINPANNDYWQIASTAYAAGVTTIVTTGTTAVDESGADYSRVFDANDVIVLKSTAVRSGTGGANAFDSNTTDAFASAIAAGQLVVGQKINVSGMGYEEGTFAFSGGQPSDGETVTINDGEKSVVFEFDDDSAFTRGNVGVTIGGSAAATAANLQAAIMDQLWKGKIQCSASVSTTTVTVRNLHPDQIANASSTALTEATAAAVVATSFSGAANASGTFTITALDDDVITVAEDVDTVNNSTLAITIKGSHLRNPGDIDDITAQSFTVETGFTDVNQFFTNKGLRVGSMGIVASAGELVSISTSLMGKDTTVAGSTTLGASPYTPLASTATPVFNATVNVGSIYKNGELLATALQSIEITGEAALREQRAVGSRFPAGIGTGRFNLTGTITSYFETLEMYDHFLNHDTISLAFDLKDNDYSVYWYTIPALKVTSDPISPGGVDQDVLEELEFTAIRDPNLNTMFMIDRFSSIIPATS